MEHRNCRRHEAENPIVCSYLTSKGAEEQFDGKMKNYCDCGMFAELQTEFKNGTILVVKTSGASWGRTPPEIQEGLRTITLAEVKWSKSMSADGVSRFATGLKYLVV